MGRGKRRAQTATRPRLYVPPSVIASVAAEPNNSQLLSFPACLPAPATWSHSPISQAQRREIKDRRRASLEKVIAKINAVDLSALTVQIRRHPLPLSPKACAEILVGGFYERLSLLGNWYEDIAQNVFGMERINDGGIDSGGRAFNFDLYIQQKGSPNATNLDAATAIARRFFEKASADEQALCLLAFGRGSAAEANHFMGNALGNLRRNQQDHPALERIGVLGAQEFWWLASGDRDCWRTIAQAVSASSPELEEARRQAKARVQKELESFRHQGRKGINAEAIIDVFDAPGRSAVEGLTLPVPAIDDLFGL